MASETLPHNFTVEGRGAFPIDMLRYDRATPATEQDANAINNAIVSGAYGSSTTRRIALRSLHLTPKRWESFGWRVVGGS